VAQASQVIDILREPEGGKSTLLFKYLTLTPKCKLPNRALTGWDGHRHGPQDSVIADVDSEISTAIAPLKTCNKSGVLWVGGHFINPFNELVP
jgi:hypothetical protein